MMWRVAAVIACFAVSGCSLLDPRAPVLILQTDGDVYAAGASVWVTITNTSDVRQPFGACIQLIERRVARWWAEHPASPGQLPCTDDLRTLGPGEKVSVRLRLPPTLSPGIYRWRLPTAANAATGAFRVVAPAM